MNNVANTALSGLQTAQLRLNAAAHNVANAQTEGFRRDVVRAQPQAQGGVQARVEKLPEPGSDLAADLVAQKSATYAFKANLQVLKTADETLGRLLNTQA